MVKYKSKGDIEMITLLSRLCIKNHTDYKSPDVRAAYGILCSIVGIFFNICLCTGKFLVGYFSHSIAIMADAINNLSDAASSVITLVGFKMSNQKPDAEHPFGHGRIEYISGFIVSMFIIMMGLELIKSSFSKILHPSSLDTSVITFIIIGLSILVKIYMAIYNYSVSKKIQSDAMKATAIDSLSDTIATSVVLISMIICHLTGKNLDGYCGVVVGLFILYAGFQATKDTISLLLGQPATQEYKDQILEIVSRYDKILDVHDLMVHDYGPGRKIISLHAEVDSKGDIMELHDCIDIVEQVLSVECNCLAVIHMDPILLNDPYVDARKVEVKQIIEKLNVTTKEKIKMHDFRVVKGPTHTNIIFDIVIPFGHEMKDEDVVELLKRKINEVNPTYYAVIHVDKE